MTMKHNQQLQHNHFRKDWQRRVRTHFDQPGRKQRRRQNRITKAAKVAPRPVDKLRPVVRCPTIKYNRRVRAGRGFTLQELKAAGVPRKLAPTIGISVDPRRSNTSEESLNANVLRLKDYMNRLILFPRRNGKTKAGDASAADIKAAKEGKGIVRDLTKGQTITNDNAVKEAKLSDIEGTEDAYKTLREAQSEARLVGVRAKRSKDKTDKEDAAKK